MNTLVAGVALERVFTEAIAIYTDAVGCTFRGAIIGLVQLRQWLVEGEDGGKGCEKEE